MINYKIIATDLDGTLLDDKRLLSSENEKCIIDLVAKDHRFVMNSGALPKDARKILEQTNIGINDETKWFVGVNGSIIYNFVTDETFINLTCRSKDEILKIMDENKTVNHDVKKINDTEYLHLVIKNKDTWYEALIKIYSLLQDSNKLQGFKDLLNLINFYEKTNYTLKDIIYFGDNLNDIPVFENPDIKCVTVKNAIEQIMKLANDVTDTNENSGFAKYLNK